MSLFGGSSRAPPYETESDQSQSLTARSSPSVERHPSPPSAQHATAVYYTSDSDADDDALTDSGTDSDSADEAQPTRPNRFKGAEARWKGYTAADRQLAASLEQLHNSDLGAHLYNAHALKHRVRRPDAAGSKTWQSKEEWYKKGSELQFTDASGTVQKAQIPPKRWTAWPQRPASATNRGRPPIHRGVTGPVEEWAIGGTGTTDPGEEIREELLATFLRLAKERWNTRVEDDLDRERGRITQSRSRSRSRSAWSARSKRSVSRNNVKMKDDEDPEAVEADGEEQKYAEDLGKKRGRVPQPESIFKPMFLADDDKAMRLLEPTINSVLSKMDDLALAIQRTRINHFGRGTYGRSSQSEGTSGAGSGEPTSRSSSKAQSRRATSRRPSTRPASRATSVRSGNESDRARRKFKPILKARERYPDSESTSTSESGAGTVKARPVPRKRGRPKSTTDDSSASSERDEWWRVGQMDWSEVLGLAATQGWDERVISRTAQRCAALFGESISFVPLDESQATQPVAEAVLYTPSTIRGPDALQPGEHTTPKRPYFQKGTLRCPHLDCPGHEKDFRIAHRVVEHCIRTHKYDPRTNNSDNEERMVGGVHIDGYRLPVAAQHGWLGRGRSKAGGERKKLKMEKEESDDDT
jgi:hypothetical protein